MATDCFNKRNSVKHKFDVEGLDVKHILGLDVNQLRDGLIKGSFTSTNLVNVFGERSQRIGRALGLSAEENFIEALELAK